jgi:hypothetical protein
VLIGRKDEQWFTLNREGKVITATRDTDKNGRLSPNEITQMMTDNGEWPACNRN